MFPKLFERGKIGRVEIENRIVKAPTLLAMRNPDGSVTDRMIRYYEEVTRGGSGLVIVEAAGVVECPDGLGLRISAPHYIPGLSFLAKVIHNNGATVAMQITRGRVGAALPAELTVEEIHETISAYGDGAERARIAGFDMVDLHACHGDLINFFLSPARNTRDDLYGGSLTNRMRFLVEIVKDIKKKTGADFPLIVRLSAIDYEPGGVVLEDTLEVVRVLEQLGVNAIDVSGGSHATEEAAIYLAPPMLMPPGQHHIPVAAAVKEIINVPVIAVGSITMPEMAEAILKSGKADFIALGRPLFADPYWPQKAKEGRPEDIVPCIRCNVGCHDIGPPFLSLRCTTNVSLGWEDRLPITPAQRVKNVAIIGGGPAGMEAARVCALRGHNVTIYEKRKLGGALLSASSVLGRLIRSGEFVPKSRSDISLLINYYVTQMKKLKVKVVQEEATVPKLKDGKFDAVIVAVGTTVKKPDVPGIDKPIVTDVLEVFGGKVKVGQRVHIIGEGLIAAQYGLFLAEQGKEVVFTTAQDEFLTGIGQPRPAYEERLAEYDKVTVYTSRLLESVTDKGAVVVDKDGNRQEIPADSIVLSTGFTPQTTLRDQLDKETELEVYAAGDCVRPSIIYDAIHGGYAAARKV